MSSLTMSSSGKPAGQPARKPSRLRMQRLLPYLLSLPALLVCIGILLPFFTAVGYSFQRYNLSFPDARGYVWFDNYISLFTDEAFWNTVRVTTMVCSNWALSRRSRVRTVHLSLRSTSTSQVPRLIIGSMVKAMPERIRGLAASRPCL